MLLQKDPLPFLFLDCSSLDLLEPHRVLASVVLVRLATFRVSTRSTLTIFTVSICAHAHARVRDEHVDDVSLHTYTYVHGGGGIRVVVEIGPQDGYFPNGSKTHVQAKLHHAEAAKEIFEGTGIVISTEGEHYLGGAIGTGFLLYTSVCQKKSGMLGE